MPVASQGAALCCLLTILSLLPGRLQAAEPDLALVLERTIPLTGVSGRIDHMAVDLSRRRLFVAELGNGTVDAIDIAAGKAVHRIDRLRDPQGVGYAPMSDRIAVASAGDGSVRLYRGEDFAPAGTVELGEDADNVRSDARSGQLLVGYGSGGIAVIDPATASVVSKIKLSGHPEGFQFDAEGHRAFVNVPDTRQIAVLDLEHGRQTASWSVPDVRANFPMALDESHTVLATVFRNPARLVLFDVRSGTAKQTLETCGDADDVFFDAVRHRIYISCGQGAIDVMQQDTAGYRRLARITTMLGARTSLFVPEWDRLFVAVRAGVLGLGSEAAILVFRPRP